MIITADLSSEQAIIDGFEEKRFWSKVKKGGPDECWVWTAATVPRGYGKMQAGHALEYAHRISWVLHNESIPTGMRVLHRCDNPPCVNPAHLFLGDHADNMKDMAIKERAGRLKVSQDDVQWIREWAAAGWPHGLLAHAVGCSRPNIQHIVSRVGRKHIP